MRRIMLIVCSFLLLAIPLGGCWNRVELNEIGIISATAVDWDKDKWIVSYQLVIPQAISAQSGSSSIGDAPVNVFSTEGKSIRKSIGNASREMSRKLYFAHNQIIVVGEAAAKKGISTILEIYMRNTDARETVSMFIAKGRARTIIEQLLPIEKIPGTAVQRLVENEEESSSLYPDMTMYRILLDLLGPGQATGIPELMIAGSNQKLNSVDALKETFTSAKIKLGKLAIISGDKLAGWLTQKEAAGAMWLANKVKRVTIQYNCSDNENTPDYSAVIVEKAKIERKIERKPDGRLLMHLSVNAQGTMLEYACSNDLEKPQPLKQEEARIAEEIKGEMEQSWQAVRNLKADIVGFGTILHRSSPKQWKELKQDWNEHFANIELDIKVKFKLARIGFSNRDFKETQKKSRS
ncbi:Ger(x)C family spore germination protein [Paenibacillus sp. HB172176]|uniref:Ger(x)C family spore germination protein n=1 Tax=Paenibacillus sp. HB172176 TaxID=2493690 RepID=UPI001439C751|nr:Ger(x)C family spore germination protein [Paenibacillus sp. HB172176]